MTVRYHMYAQKEQCVKLHHGSEVVLTYYCIVNVQACHFLVCVCVCLVCFLVVFFMKEKCWKLKSQRYYVPHNRVNVWYFFNLFKRKVRFISHSWSIVILWLRSTLRDRRRCPVPFQQNIQKNIFVDVVCQSINNLHKILEGKILKTCTQT